MLTLSSPAFHHGARLPRRFTAEGENVSPPLVWAGVPAGTKEFVLICEDPDAPAKPWVHWLVYNISPLTRSFPEGRAPAAHQGRTNLDGSGYHGPLPPAGDGPHHYHFRIYALDTHLDVSPDADRDEVLAAMEGHILEDGELVGTYER